jgi:single-strand DNA-binding protein
MNRVVLCGRLTGRPKRSYTPCGIAVAEFRLLVLREDPRDPTPGDEIECVAFRQVAEELTDWGERSHRVNLEGRLRLEVLRTGDARQAKALKVFVERAYFVDPVKDVTPAPLRALPESPSAPTGSPGSNGGLLAAKAPGAGSPPAAVQKAAA